VDAFLLSRGKERKSHISPCTRPGEEEGPTTVKVGESK